MSDEDFIRQTIKLAKKGLGWTNPNPMVGAILAKNGQIIATGYHKKFGFPHAEIEALKKAKDQAEGTTLYLNLEPCCHFGKTPPCTDAIIKAGIKKVVCSTSDPNPKVSGQGIARLQRTGIDVSVGALESEARVLNEAFFTFHEKKRPFIALKFASSLDGKIATHTGDSKWITNEKARNYARESRGQHQAVLVGINTILRDNPHLGNTLRIILDSTLKIPLDSNVLRDSNVLIATTVRANKEKKKILEERGISLLTFKEKTIPLLKLLKKLWEKAIISVLVEGGSLTLGSFLDMHLVDKVYAFHAPLLIGGEKAKTVIAGQGIKTISEAVHLKDLILRRFGDNLLTIGYVI